MGDNEHAPESDGDNGEYGQKAPFTGVADGVAPKELGGGL